MGREGGRCGWGVRERGVVGCEGEICRWDEREGEMCRWDVREGGVGGV